MWICFFDPKKKCLTSEKIIEIINDAIINFDFENHSFCHYFVDLFMFFKNTDLFKNNWKYIQSKLLNNSNESDNLRKKIILWG